MSTDDLRDQAAHTLLDSIRADAVNLAAERSPHGHPLPDSEIRAAWAGVDAALAAVRAETVERIARIVEVRADDRVLRRSWSKHSHEWVEGYKSGTIDAGTIIREHGAEGLLRGSNG